MNRNTKKGFTLIELLVVIAIIGILSAVVLASLNTARNKAATASVQSNLKTITTQAEMYYDDHSMSYGAATSGPCEGENMFTTTTIEQALNEAEKSGANGASPVCYIDNSGQNWAVSMQLKVSSGGTTGGAHWCVDSTGAARQIENAITSAVCPAEYIEP